MVIGLGIDSVEIARFAHWHSYPMHKLERMFSPKEIEYCLQNPAKSAERFAARFAAKEALFKAFNQAFPDKNINLFTVARFCELVKTEKAPELQVQWHALELQALQALISITHSRNIASAVVILQKL